ncbi:MAG: DsbA family protein [Parvibaculaceae bacterium]|nr:DsbA family protein [Parvibaculaceae bacterium]
MTNSPQATPNQAAPSKIVDLFFSFRSPYSYLITPRIVQLEKDYDVTVNVRPVYPIAVRIKDFFKEVNPLWPPYLLKDTVRVAQMEGMDYAWPSPDPIVMDLASGVVPEEQPYIHRLTRLGVAAGEKGQALPFISEIGKLTFGGVKNWHEGEHIAQATARAGLDLAELDQLIIDKADHYAAAITSNEAAQKAAGHWGVPLMAYENEPFFGQDRISHLRWRLDQKNLKK